MKNILVPIDFSNASHNAGKYAISLAGVFDANLIFLYAYMPPPVIDEISASALLVSNAELIEGYEEKMEQEIETLIKEKNSKIKKLVREGFALDIIKEMALENNVDVIVMGMKGKGKSSHTFGSTTTTIIRRTSVPVMVIPENAVYHSMNKITLASDFDAQTELKRYSLLHELAKRYNSEIQIVNVQKKELVLTPGNEIGKTKTDVAFSDLNHKFYTIEEDNIEKGLNKFLENNPSDILAMVAHKHSYIERIFGNIHTTKMSYQINIPLLVLQNK
ncbi:MAG TPA: universal stress protein [Hanamia sp.]